MKVGLVFQDRKPQFEASFRSGENKSEKNMHYFDDD